MENSQNTNKKRISLKDIILFVYCLIYLLKALLSVYNDFIDIDEEDEPEKCSYSVTVNVQQ